MINPQRPDFENTPVSPQRPEYRYRPAGETPAPLVSIVTPYYNTGAIFHETARSVLQQSFQHWEWLIANDGSTVPEALEVLDHYRSLDPRIRVIDLPRNMGTSAAKNWAIREART
ncbi:MAG TPA: glycosyltransferase, partial [Chloroflexi bacterium]|nr:glycosyltransferase [Chloroflexota bacterium]